MPGIVELPASLELLEQLARSGLGERRYTAPARYTTIIGKTHSRFFFAPGPVVQRAVAARAEVAPIVAPRSRIDKSAPELDMMSHERRESRALERQAVDRT